MSMRPRLLSFSLGVVLAGCGLVFAQPVVPNSPQPASLSEQMVQGKASLQLMMERFGSDSREERREAAFAIISLREHYIDSLQNHVERGFRGELSAMMQRQLLTALTQLRPTSPRITEGAIEHFNFYWSPMISMGGPDVRAQTALGIPVFSSFPALPILAKKIAASPLPENNKRMGDPQNSLRCALAIMGAGSAAWLEREAKDAPGEASRAALKKAAAFTATQIWQPDTTQSIMPALSGFWPAFRLTNGNSMRFPPAIDREKPLDAFKFNWNAPDDLVKSANPQGRYIDTPQVTKHALRAISKPFSLVEDNFMNRIEALPKGSRLPHKQFSPAAQTDAIRVLGCLRSAEAGYFIWQRLLAKSRALPLEQDASEDTAACLRALGQIDIPAAYFLTEQIAKLPSENHQLATTYMLSKILGRYSSFWVQREIVKYKRFCDWSKDDKTEMQGYLTSIKRLENALKVGKAKKWFEGEYYGYNDPHAYELIFPDN